MNDQRINKIYNYIKEMEDFFYKPIMDDKCQENSVVYMQCLFSATALQKARYFIENLMDESEQDE